MKSNWSNYPLTLFSDALASSAGGILVIAIALCLGTFIGCWIFDNGFDDLTAVPVAALFAIGVSFVQLWGLIYAVILAGIIYRTLHDEASRTVVGFAVTVLQTFVVVVDTLIAERFEDLGANDIPRLLLVFGVYATAVLAGWRIRRHLRRRELQSQASCCGPQLNTQRNDP